MKKFIFLLLLSFVFSSASAQTLTVSGCLELNSNIRQGMRDSGASSYVYALQSFLKTNNQMTVNPTGYFGVLTLKGVKNFQKVNNITPTGFVGPLTRAKIKEISCVIKITDPAPVPIPENPPVTPNVPVVETPAPVPTVTPTAPVVEDVILTSPNNSSLRVKTDGTISINSTSVVVKGSVTAGARSATMRWFEITTNPSVYKMSETTISTKKPQKANDNFIEVLEGLKPDTNYYYRACAENADLGQKSCGGTVSVKTNQI
jgi:hypothetical protein